MLIEKKYNRQLAFAYAEKWAFGRNPLFYNFTGIGGDCTNFVSQCLYAGCCEMDYDKESGWYYVNSNDRAPSWTSVEFFYEFVTGNKGIGPFGFETYPGGLQVGDIIQLGKSNGTFYHTLFVTGTAPGTYLVSTHSDDAFDRPLNSYHYSESRFLHIVGIRENVKDTDSCFENLINGIKI